MQTGQNIYFKAENYSKNIFIFNTWLNPNKTFLKVPILELLRTAFLSFQPSLIQASLLQISPGYDYDNHGVSYKLNIFWSTCQCAKK